MNVKNNKSGFTLLEIIIVIIIVGVLASLALPRFFSTVAFSRSSEALNILGTVKRAADNCSMLGGSAQDYSTCVTFDQLGLEDPTGTPNSHFGYAIDYATPPAYVITATRNAVDPDAANGDTIVLSLNTGTGIVTKSGTGLFSGIK